MAPPSQVDGKPYLVISRPGGHGTLDWAAVTALLEPQRHHEHRHQVTSLTAGSTSWPAGSPASPKATATPVYWAANRVSDLSPLAAAARQAGLAEPDHPHPRLRPPHPPARSPGRGDDLR